jgi:hypothetical protein
VNRTIASCKPLPEHGFQGVLRLAQMADAKGEQLVMKNRLLLRLIESAPAAPHGYEKLIALAESGSPDGDCHVSPRLVKHLLGARDTQPRKTIVEGVLEDLETHMALRDAFATLMGK